VNAPIRSISRTRELIVSDLRNRPECCCLAQISFIASKHGRRRVEVDDVPGQDQVRRPGLLGGISLLYRVHQCCRHLLMRRPERT
jgi:hypothetical protein